MKQQITTAIRGQRVEAARRDKVIAANLEELGYG
jgi:hypothetical protein